MSFDFNYLAISSQAVCPEPIHERVNRLFELGVPAVQIRDKSVTDRRRAEWIRKISRSNHKLLISNRIDFVYMFDLTGVHCASDSIPQNVIVENLPSQAVIGASTHTTDEVRMAQEHGLDYVTYGPIFPTPSKPGLDESDIPGLDGLEQVTDQFDIPILALGGVSPAYVEECIGAGASGVAGIRALFKPEDPTENWSRIINQLK